MTRSVEIPEAAGWTMQDELERVIGEVLANPAYQGASLETQKLMLANAIHALLEAPPAPAGDGGLRDASGDPKLSNPDGLREALEQTAREKIAEWYGAEWDASEDKFYETYDGGGISCVDDEAMLELRGVRLALDLALAAHPAAPAPVVGVCEHPSDIFGPCTLLQGHELHGYLHQNTKGETWSNFGEPAHTAQPAEPQSAVPQPVDREALEQRICRVYIDGGAHITHAQEAATEIVDAIADLVLAGGEQS